MTRRKRARVPRPIQSHSELVNAWLHGRVDTSPFEWHKANSSQHVHQRRSYGRFLLTTSAAGLAGVVFAPQLAYCREFYSNAIAAGSRMHSVYTCAPATDTDNWFLTATGAPLIGQHINASATNNDTGPVRWVAAQVTVQYLGTKLASGGQSVMVQGGYEQSLLYFRNSPVGVSFADMSKAPVGSLRSLGTQAQTFRFVNGSPTRSDFFDSSRDWSWDSVSNEIVPENAFEHSDIGFTAGVMVKTATPSVPVVITVEFWHEDRLVPVSGLNSQPMIPATHLAVGNPVKHAQQSAVVAHHTQNLNLGAIPGFINAVGQLAANTLPRMLGGLERAAASVGRGLVTAAESAPLAIGYV